MYEMRNLTTSRLTKLRKQGCDIESFGQFLCQTETVTLLIRMTVVHLQQFNIIDYAFKYYFKGTC